MLWPLREGLGMLDRCGAERSGDRGERCGSKSGKGGRRVEKRACFSLFPLVFLLFLRCSSECDVLPRKRTSRWGKTGKSRSSEVGTDLDPVNRRTPAQRCRRGLRMARALGDQRRSVTPGASSETRSIAQHSTFPMGPTSCCATSAPSMVNAIAVATASDIAARR